jgi:DnaK suppressor protein
MSDDADRADAHTATWLDACVAYARGPHAGRGTSHCTDCGEPIPQARRRAHPYARRCIHCQERAER